MLELWKGTSMTLISADIRAQWRQRALAAQSHEVSATLLRLKNVKEFLPFYDETATGDPATRIEIMQEAAEDNGMALASWDERVRQVKRLENGLDALITCFEHGVTWNHVKQALGVSERPLDLLTAAWKHGGEDGNRVMSVAEMVAFALTGKTDTTPEVEVSNLLQWVSGKFLKLLAIPNEKRGEFENDLARLVAKWQKTRP
jgi:hypothetical protein